MGCCNKVLDERPISRLRWWAGMCVMLASHAFVWALLTLGAPFSPRYRKLRDGWRAYSRDVLRSCLAKEGFRVGAAPPPPCDCGYRAPDGPRGQG
jgi:hypothetical protein